MSGDPLVLFYRGLAPDNRGRYLADVLAFDDDALEYTHDYIQWLFPITTVGVNPFAPPASAATIQAFREDPVLRATLGRSFERMLAFYGLKRSGSDIVPAENFDERRRWLTAGNHNHLRLTRILTSLRLFGLDADARALHRCLVAVAQRERAAGRQSVSDITLRFWDDAVRD